MLEPSHCDMPEGSPSFRFLEANQMRVLVDLVEIHLVKVTHSRQDDAVFELADVVQVLLERHWVCPRWRIIGFVLWQRWQGTLREITGLDHSLRLRASNAGLRD